MSAINRHLFAGSTELVGDWIHRHDDVQQENLQGGRWGLAQIVHAVYLVCSCSVSEISLLNMVLHQ